MAKKTRLTKKEVIAISRIVDKLNALYRDYMDEENDIPLQVEGNGSVGSNLSCACASLEVILQEYCNEDSSEEKPVATPVPCSYVNCNDVEGMLANRNITDDEKRLLAEVIQYGSWGDCDMEFSTGNGNSYTFYAYGYITNKNQYPSSQYSGKKRSAMFRSIYRKFGLDEHGCGEFITQISNWWEDGSGDVMFIKNEFINPFETWAETYLKTH